MVENNKSGANPGVHTLEDALNEFVQSKQKGQGSGNYAADADRVVGKWVEWCADRDITHLEDVDARLLRRWVQRYLKQRARASEAGNGGISGRTARQYFALVRAFLSYCEEWNWIVSNPANEARVKDELPDESLGATNSDTQTWSVDERDQLVQYVNERAYRAIEEKGFEAVDEFRDRAVVYLLAYSGARSAELFRDSGDSRRRGLWWSDIDFDGTTIEVLGKNQEREPLQFPEVAHEALRQFKRISKPPCEDWPLFPTRHAPSLYKRVSEELDREPDNNPLETLRSAEVPPPSITTATVRTILKRLCDDGDIDVEGDHEYLKPHGARRGLGKQLYQEAGHQYAQKALRHSDPVTTSEMYADIEAGEVADVTNEVLGPD